MSDKRKQEAAANTGSGSTRQGETPREEPAAPGTPNGPLASGQRWTAARKREVALRLLRGESLETLSRELGVEPPYRLAAGSTRGEIAIRVWLMERRGVPHPPRT